MTLGLKMQREVMLTNLENNLIRVVDGLYGKSIEDCSEEELYCSIVSLTKEHLNITTPISGDKKVYYISAEFLIGKLLSNNLINLGVYGKLEEILNAHGKTLRSIEEIEPEPSLGNGGLGRLAACFLDSIATLGLYGDGIGLNYHFGLFKQSFEEKLQVSKINPWIESTSWLKETGISYEIALGKEKAKSVLYDIDVVGYNNGRNKLHLFDIATVDESIVKEGIDFDKTDVLKNLTLFLYPDDSDEAGQLLRIHQQYFMVSNAAYYILSELKKKQYDLRRMYDYAVIQINDTHPTLIIPELIRILVEDKAFSMDEAIEVVSKTCAYTNHTILAEALETWPIKYLEKVVPKLVPIIKVLDKKAKAKYKNPKVAIIDTQKRVHMAHIDIHYCFSVNGVAAIHTEILNHSELKDFYSIYPDKFNNKTNGITFRRWLLGCNHELTELLTKTIGEGFKYDATRLEKLLDFKSNEKLLNQIVSIKKEKKRELAEYIEKTQGVILNPDSVFDIQIKRLHEYKRQQMNALYIIHKYLEIKGGKKPVVPMTFIFGAKAAPAYIIAKDIIHLLLVLQEIVNKDPDVNQYMTVLMVENYNVTKAEKLIPAADISEQISLASKEASGTGNMKFMLNGAITLGTSDGANVEINELVGNDNIYIFGKKSDEIIEHYEKADYDAKKIYKSSSVVKEAVDFIVGKKALKVGNKESLTRLHNELIHKDWFMTLLDLEEYIAMKDKVFSHYVHKPAKWKKMMLTNIAKAGYFSSDRTIEEYNKDIWKLKKSQN